MFTVSWPGCSESSVRHHVVGGFLPTAGLHWVPSGQEGKSVPQTGRQTDSCKGQASSTPLMFACLDVPLEQTECLILWNQAQTTSKLCGWYRHSLPPLMWWSRIRLFILISKVISIILKWCPLTLIRLGGGGHDGPPSTFRNAQSSRHDTLWQFSFEFPRKFWRQICGRPGVRFRSYVTFCTC